MMTYDKHLILGILVILMFISSIFSPYPNGQLKLMPPENGMYLAAFPNFGGSEDKVSAEKIFDFCKLSGKRIAWAYFSNNWNNGIKFPDRCINIIHLSGFTPYVRLMPRTNFEEGKKDSTYSMQKIIDGKFDADLIQWAKKARALKYPIIVEFAPEPNGNWFPWSGIFNGGGKTTGYGDPMLPDGPERYRDAYRHIIDIFKSEGVKNITWMFHIDAHSMPAEKWNSMKAYYPGDNYIDWIGVSAYGALQPSDDWVSFKDVMDEAYPELSKISSKKPLAVLEFGVIEDNRDKLRKARWITEAFNVIKSGRYPRIKAVSYWDEKWQNEDETYSDLRINSSKETLNAYRKGISSSIFVTSPHFSNWDADKIYSMNNVNDFLYQLQDIDLEKIGKTKFDLAIIDYSKDGSNEERFTPEEVYRLEHSAGGQKIVLSYLSIGEAEDYRWYWKNTWDENKDGTPDKGAPNWLGPENPDWEGNYRVKYWNEGWKKIVYNYLDKIIDAGFNGVYLDTVDTYEYWEEHASDKKTREKAEAEMVKFVKQISDYVRNKRGRRNFLIFVQNAEELGVHKDYLNAINGIGKEDLWFNGNTPQPTSYTKESIKYLNLFKNSGKIVLVTDYVRKKSLIDKFYSNAIDNGFIPYATVRDLDKLIINPGHAPD